MRWIRPLLLFAGLVLIAAPAKAQDILGGDIAGFGPNGLSNGLGYRMRQLGMRGGGYWTGLYYPVDASNGPGVYYLANFNGLNGAPSEKALAAGWGFSPPWSKAYRQGQPRKPLGHLFHRHKD
jgi:hypothetical protein